MSAPAKYIANCRAGQHRHRQTINTQGTLPGLPPITALSRCPTAEARSAVLACIIGRHRFAGPVTAGNLLHSPILHGGILWIRIWQLGWFPLLRFLPGLDVRHCDFMT